jgi:hypothetical protein
MKYTFLLILLVSLCAGGVLADTITLSSEITEVRDIQYVPGNNPAQRLDLHLPELTSKKPLRSFLVTLRSRVVS